jgi:hypothetical protein
MAGVDDASDASNEESVIILAQFNEAILVKDDSAAKHHPINTNLVLLDSQSTVDLFSNPDHVTNIRPATTPTRVHCNKGTLATNKEADFGDTPVNFDSRGIANILSLYCCPKLFTGIEKHCLREVYKGRSRLSKCDGKLIMDLIWFKMKKQLKREIVCIT